jgi:hypothetical protein
VFEFVQSENISLRNIRITLELSLTIPGTSASIERVFSVTNALWTDEKKFPRWNHQGSDSGKNSFSGPFMQRLLYFDFKEIKITARNSFVPEVRNIYPKGGTNYYNVRWKLIANEIL